MRKFYLISSIVIDGLLSFLLILMLFALGEDEGYYTFIAFMTMPLITLTCMAINIFGLVKNPKIRTIILSKCGAIFTLAGLGMAFYPDGIYALIVFWSIAILFYVILFCINYVSKERRKTHNDSDFHGKYIYKAKWAWDDAALEYMKKNGIASLEDLTDQDNEAIYRYALMPIVYLFYWLIVNDKMKERFYKEYVSGFETRLSDGSINSLDLLVANMDCVFYGDDVDDGVYDFLESYAELKFANIYKDKLAFDYYEVCVKPHGYYYCLDYDINERDLMVAKISEAYDRWLKVGKNIQSFDDKEEMFEQKKLKLKSKKFGCELGLYVDCKLLADAEACDQAAEAYDQAAASKDSGYQVAGYQDANQDQLPACIDEYAKACLADFDGLDEFELNRIDRLFADIYGDSLKGHVLDQIHLDSIYIYKRQNNDRTAYVLTGEADFEEEHGISIYIRDGVVFHTAFSYDFDELYTEDLKLMYEIAKLRLEDIKSMEEVLKLESKGILVKELLWPEDLGGQNDSKNVIYMPALLLPLKRKIDERIRAIRAMGLDSYVYQVIYYDDKFPFVPQHISVRQDCEPSKAEFGFWISVWQ